MAFTKDNLKELKEFLEARELIKRWLDDHSWPDLVGEGDDDAKRKTKRELRIKEASEKLKLLDKWIWEKLEATTA